MKAIVKRQTIVANPRRHKIVVFRSHPGPPGQGSIEDLNALTTLDKTSLVAAINELKAQINAITPRDQVEV